MERFDYKLNNNAKDKINNYIFVYILIQPILSYYIFFSDKIRNMFVLSPATIIRSIGFIFIFMFFLLNVTDTKKAIKHLLIYILIYFLYAVVHIYCGLKINFLPDNFKFSLIEELFYLFRMTIPVLFFIVLYNSKPKFNEVLKILYYVGIVVSLTIIISNLLNISLISYSEKFELVDINLFKWFSTSITQEQFRKMTSKGYYLFANEIGNILLIFLSVDILMLYKECTVKNAFALFLNLLSLLMLGTKVSFFGAYILIMSSLIIYFFTNFINKEISLNFVKKYFIVVYFFIIVTLFSPIMLRLNLFELINKHLVFEYIYIFLVLLMIMSLLKYKERKNNVYFIFVLVFFLVISLDTIVKERCHTYNPNTDNTTIVIDEKTEIKKIEKLEDSIIFKDFYLIIYPENYDYEFWKNLIEKPLSEYDNTRKVQNHIFDRIMFNSTKENGNLYKLFGLSYSNFRGSNQYQIYLEKDIKVHLYTLGIVGTFLYIGPYILFVIYGIIDFILNLTKERDYNKIMILITVGLIMFTSYFGGHVFDEMFPTIIMSVFIYLFFIKNTGVERNE